MFASRVKFRRTLNLVDLLIDPCAHEAARLQIRQHLGVFALAFAYQRRKQQRGAPLGKCQDQVNHLAHGLRRQIRTVLGAARDAGARKQEP